MKSENIHDIQFRMKIWANASDLDLALTDDSKAPQR